MDHLNPLASFLKSNHTLAQVSAHTHTHLHMHPDAAALMGIPSFPGNLPPRGCDVSGSHFDPQGFDRPTPAVTRWRWPGCGPRPTTCPD